MIQFFVQSRGLSLDLAQFPLQRAFLGLETNCPRDFDKETVQRCIHIILVEEKVFHVLDIHEGGFGIWEVLNRDLVEEVWIINIL